MKAHPNRRRRGARVRGAALAAVLCLGATGLAPIDYDRYHDYDALTRAVRELASAHRGTATVVSLGQTAEGRDIWALEVAGPGPLAPSERPALLVVGNLEADRVIGSELALYLAEHLLTRAASDEAVAGQLRDRTFYIVPRANPDGAERMFARVRSDYRLTMRPVDDDVDGRVDEDGPEDLNGDGLITLMRVADPGGPYMIDPNESRLLRPADAGKGESGGYEVYVEGRDNDGDGYLNEDGPGGVDLNRNFQHAYPYYAPDAGPHMVSEPESRALMDYVLARRNIAAVLTFGASDNLVGELGRQGEAPAPSPLALPAYPGAHLEEARGVGTVERPRRYRFGFGFFGQQGRSAGDDARRRPSRRPATTVDEADREYYGTIGERYRELTGIETVANTRKPEGAFHDFAYFQFGVPAFSTPGWGIDGPDDQAGATPSASDGAERADAEGRPRALRGRPSGAPAVAGARQRPGVNGGAGSGADAKLLAWMDGAGVDGFVAWTEYDHPDLGPVEIGGFRPYATSNPPVDRIPELGAKHAEFALYVASLLPRIRIAETAVTAHGGGLFEVTAEVENVGYLPTALAQGVTARAVAPVMVQLGIDPDALVTGDAMTSFIPALAGSGSRKSFSWLVRGRHGQEVELRVVAQKAGSATTTVTLR
jgi:hypothetical protein